MTYMVIDPTDGVIMSGWKQLQGKGPQITNEIEVEEM